jgi:hypothetical protein
MLLIREATEADCLEMAPQMRLEDVLECEGTDVDPLKALQFGVRHGEAWTVRDAEGIVCIYGLVRGGVASGSAIVWLLGTERFKRHAKSSIRIARRQLATWHRRYPILGNRVPMESYSRRWLARLGFRFGPMDEKGWVRFRSVANV